MSLQRKSLLFDRRSRLTWQQTFRSQGIKLYEGVSRELLARGYLLTTCCSTTKGIAKTNRELLASEMYLGKPQVEFYEFCDRNNLRYGILSDLYGLHMDTERFPLYDIGPQQLPDTVLWRRGEMIRDVCDRLGYKGIIFQLCSPVRARTYLVMALASRLPVVYTIPLKLID